jgi:hypothetical protein
MTPLALMVVADQVAGDLPLDLTALKLFRVT